MWGLEYDAAATVRMPEPKLRKGTYLLGLPCFDAGSGPKPISEVQRLVGNAQYWATVQQSVKPELGALYEFLRRSQTRGVVTDPPGEPWEVERVYQEFDDAVELMRVLIARPETWRSTFTSGSDGMLEPGERLAL